MHTAHTPVSMCMHMHVKDVGSFYLSASDIRRISTIPMEGRCDAPPQSAQQSWRNFFPHSHQTRGPGQAQGWVLHSLHSLALERSESMFVPALLLSRLCWGHRGSLINHSVYVGTWWASYAILRQTLLSKRFGSDVWLNIH